MMDLNHLIHNFTLITLVALSVTTWAVIVVKLIQLKKARKMGEAFIEGFWKAKDLTDAARYSKTAEQSAQQRIAYQHFATLSELNDDVHQDLNHTWSRQDLLERVLTKHVKNERHIFEKGLALLASIGNSAPFIGLFGTVFGIIGALSAIAASGSASMDVVAGPIGAALVATGIGIAVAVPAVLAYNFFIRKTKILGSELDDFATDLVNFAQKTGFQVTTITPVSTVKVEHQTVTAKGVAA
ncbi:MotA/TolQ/ExbB proton channel family protein [Acinetobacter chinensis]|uniref:MotA/TolQ/ExbB proton channel family protein n=1 Tax=Acinetobacter chinensis TaxID=2004650 RepID=A0ABU3WAM2_9GAMM|nr:MotA/TolQ/ExbB proton channel family protein [Acinetobacter chinensis]MDV2467451.1 MotA/TolQ/ExbB proton channel family protein [Acinetobacter chinensis]